MCASPSPPVGSVAGIRHSRTSPSRSYGSIDSCGPAVDSMHVSLCSQNARSECTYVVDLAADSEALVEREAAEEAVAEADAPAASVAAKAAVGVSVATVELGIHRESCSPDTHRGRTCARLHTSWRTLDYASGLARAHAGSPPAHRRARNHSDCTSTVRSVRTSPRMPGPRRKKAEARIARAAARAAERRIGGTRCHANVAATHA